MSWYIDTKNTTASVSYTVGPQAEDAASAAIKAKLLSAGVSMPDESVTALVKAVVDAIGEDI